MILDTKHFGKIEINEQKVIHFPEGIPAFENEKQFIIIDNEDKDSPFGWLQSITNPNLAFVTINPFSVYPDYDIVIPKATITKLKIEDKKDIMVLSLVVIPNDINKITANLQAPIIINASRKLGKQVILDDIRYSTKHYIFQQNAIVGGI